MESADVPLITPSTSQLRADAVWVTIANWADALASRFGSSTVVTPTERFTPGEVRRAVWTPGRASTAPVTAGRQRHHRLLAKDVRSLLRGARFRLDIETPWPGATPYVWQHHDLFQTAGFRLADASGVPLVLFVDAPQVWEASQWGVRRPGWGSLAERWGESWQFEHADVVACVSEEVADAVVARGAPTPRVIVTPCSADPARFERATDLRADLDLEGRVVIGWIGSFRPFHNADMLVRSVAEIAAGRDDVALLMVGDGPTRSECESLAAALGVTARFPGIVPNEDVPDHVTTMDVGTILSEAGGDFHYSPLKLKEYLAAGLPSVVPGVGEMKRTLNGGVDALLYPPGDHAALTAQLRHLATDPVRRDAVGRNGRAVFDAEFGMGGQLDAVDAVLSL